MGAKEINQINNILTVALYMTALFFSGLVIITASSLESIIYPVVKDFEVLTFVYQDESVMLTGIMEKVRSCTPELVTFWDRDESTGEMHQLFVDFRPDVYHDPATVLTQRPEGIQHWGTWELFIPQKLYDTFVIISIHDCHPLWKTESILLEQPWDALSTEIPRVSRLTL